MAFEATLFDLDGVLVSTDELHFQSWLRLTREEGIPFDRARNRLLLGVSRMESLAIVLEKAPRPYDPEERQELADRKNRYFLDLTEDLGEKDLLPGGRELVRAVREQGIRTAICSGSRNAGYLAERLGLMSLLDALVDGNDIVRTKPDPQVFLLGAERLRVAPEACLVVEDAEVGIQAARAAGMRSLGVGDPERLRDADRVVADLTAVGPAELAALFRPVGG